MVSYPSGMADTLSCRPTSRAAAAAAAAGTSLRAAGAFQATRATAEDVFLAAMTRRVDELMDAVDQEADWFPARPAAGPTAAAGSLAAGLRDLLPRLAALPAAVREAVHYTTFKHVAARLAAAPCAPRVKRVNVEAFARVEHDIKLIIDVAEETGIPGLRDCLAPITQMVALMMGNNIAAIADEVQRFQHYPSVDLGQLRTVLDKYREAGGGFGLLPGRAAGPSRKKEVDAALKKLRELVRD